MNMKRITGLSFLLLAAGLAPTAVRAAAPRAVNPAGVPYTFDNSAPIQYSIDQGDLGLLKHADAAALVKNAFQEWSSVTTAKLAFTEDTTQKDQFSPSAGSLDSFLNSLPATVNPVVFDRDGSIAAEFGVSPLVLAFGRRLRSDSATARIQQGIVVINAAAMDGLFDPDDVTKDDLTRTILFAVGQMLGVGFSDTNDELVFDGNPAGHNAVPIMNPGSETGLVLGGGFALTLDDQMAVSMLYPSDAFKSTTGTIQGQLLLPDGVTGLQGIDVIARKMDDPVNSVVSAITGVTFRSPLSVGSEDATQRGAFQIHVPPGSYTLEFRPLRVNIGPLAALGQPSPLPGGPQFYQASAAPSPTAGPLVPASATPIMVTAGQTTPPVKFVAAGTAAPAPQMVTQAKPDDSPANAQLLPPSAVVTGSVSPQDPGQISIALDVQTMQDAQNGSVTHVQDKVENLYRIVVQQQSILTLFLQPKGNSGILQLYLLQGFPGGSNPTTLGFVSSNPGARALQVTAAPGTYFVGVSAFSGTVGMPAATATDYTLSLTTTPLTGPPAPPAPVMDQLVLGDVTSTGATASWTTDLDTTADAVVAIPSQDFGDPMAAQTHHLPINGLTAGTYAALYPIAQTQDGVQGFLPRVFFHTADSTAASGPAQVQAAVLGGVLDTIGTGDAAQDTILVEIGLRNSGGPATNVQITGLTPSPGWKLAHPITQPLTIGAIGSNGAAVVVVRLLRDGTGPAPLATVSGTGSLAGSGGATANFTISGP